MTIPSLITTGGAAWVAAASPPAPPAPPSEVTMMPNPSKLPGFLQLTDLINGIGGWALIAAMLGIVIGAVLWAFGHYSQNYQQAYNGRRGVLVSAFAAVLIGGAPAIINALFSQGGKIH